MKFLKFLKMCWTLPGRTLYDPNANTVFTVDSVEWNRVIIGSPCTFYNDARRQVYSQDPRSLTPLSHEYIKGCVVIKRVDEVLVWDTVGWAVPGRVRQI